MIIILLLNLYSVMLSLSSHNPLIQIIQYNNMTLTVLYVHFIHPVLGYCPTGILILRYDREQFFYRKKGYTPPPVYHVIGCDHVRYTKLLVPVTVIIAEKMNILFCLLNLYLKSDVYKTRNRKYWCASEYLQIYIYAAP